jgi:hypothetical protein
LIPRVATQCWENLTALYYVLRRKRGEWHTRPADLARTEARILHQMRALEAMGPDTWQVVEESLNPEDPGEAFGALYLAIAYDDRSRTQTLLQRSQDCAAVAEAIGWAPRKRIKDLGALCDEFRLDAAWWNVVWRTGIPVDSTEIRRALTSGSPAMAMAAVRVAATARLIDLAATIGEIAIGGDGVLRQSARLALVLLNAWPPSSLAELASQRPILPGVAAILEQIEPGLVPRKDPRISCFLAGCSGRTAELDFLLESMAVPERARLAWLAFSTLAGLPFDGGRFTIAAPSGLSSGPDDIPEHDEVAMDPDEGIPYPDQSALSDWWRQKRSTFGWPQGLLGNELGIASATSAINDGPSLGALTGAAWLALNNPEMQYAKVVRTLLDIDKPLFR